MRHLYDSLRACAKEEEVKAEFCKFFKMKIFALRGIDHYTEHVLFEFKHDRNLLGNMLFSAAISDHSLPHDPLRFLRDMRGANCPGR